MTDRLIKITAFKTADGRLFEDGISARQAILEDIVREAGQKAGLEGGALYRDDVEKFFLDNFDLVRRELDQTMGSLGT